MNVNTYDEFLFQNLTLFNTHTHTDFFFYFFLSWNRVGEKNSLPFFVLNFEQNLKVPITELRVIIQNWRQVDQTDRQYVLRGLGAEQGQHNAYEFISLLLSLLVVICLLLNVLLAHESLAFN